MEVYEAILKRRSIRRFKQKEIRRDLLVKLVKSARVAPSAANLQPCEYVVIDDRKLLPLVFFTLKWAGYVAPRGNPPEGETPAAYIVVLVNKEKQKITPAYDVGAAVENIMLTALEEGIGSCWLGSIDREKLREVLGIPKMMKIDSVVALGYPNENPVLEEMADSIKYWKDETGVFHVPKRRLDDIIHLNRY